MDVIEVISQPFITIATSIEIWTGERKVFSGTHLDEGILDFLSSKVNAATFNAERNLLRVTVD